MEKSQVISAEVAKQEIENWLNIRRVKQSLRQKYNDAVALLEEAVCEGCLVLQEDGSLKQSLIFPIETKDGTIATTDLVFKPRFKVKDLSMQTQDTNATNYVDINISYISAVTGLSKALVREMDTEDFKLAQNIVAFFM